MSFMEIPHGGHKGDGATLRALLSERLAQRAHPVVNLHDSTSIHSHQRSSAK
jgi:hypothetical protein